MEAAILAAEEEWRPAGGRREAATGRARGPGRGLSGDGGGAADGRAAVRPVAGAGSQTRVVNDPRASCTGKPGRSGSAADRPMAQIPS